MDSVELLTPRFCDAAVEITVEPELGELPLTTLLLTVVGMAGFLTEDEFDDGVVASVVF